MPRTTCTVRAGEKILIDKVARMAENAPLLSTQIPQIPFGVTYLLLQSTSLIIFGATVATTMLATWLLLEVWLNFQSKSNGKNANWK